MKLKRLVFNIFVLLSVVLAGCSDVETEENKDTKIEEENFTPIKYRLTGWAHSDDECNLTYLEPFRYIKSIQGEKIYATTEDKISIDKIGTTDSYLDYIDVTLKTNNKVTFELHNVYDYTLIFSIQKYKDNIYCIVLFADRGYCKGCFMQKLE